MKPREGDLIKTISQVVFDVKGLLHPPNKVIAFPRFIPSFSGARKTIDTSYDKVYNLDDRFRYLQLNHPEMIVFDPVFDETLCEVPTQQIVQHYQPAKKLAKLRKSKELTILESKALEIATSIKEKAGIPWSAIGISGSIMAGLATQTSDIDPLVYGVKNSRKVYDALQVLLNQPESGFKTYSQMELKTLFDFRSKDTQMSFQDFTSVESRKTFQGMFRGTDYFIRFVKDWAELDEKYGDICYQNSGYIRITAIIADATDALFTPCTYKLKNVEIIEGHLLSPITEVVSFRGRFCMQATKNEKIVAQGKAELVTNNRTGDKYYRLILGNKPSDYMIRSH